MKKLVKPTNPEAQVPDITGFSGYFLPNAWTLKDFGTYLMRRENKKEIESKSSIQLREEAEKAVHETVRRQLLAEQSKTARELGEAISRTFDAFLRSKLAFLQLLSVMLLNT